MRIFILLMLLAMQGTAQTQVGADGIKYDSLYLSSDNLNRLTIGDSTASKHYVDSVVAAGGGGSAVWGSITGTLSNQTDLQTALNGKLNTSDTATMLLHYMEYGDTTAMLAPYLKSATAAATYATITNLALKLNISDTASMLSHYAELSELDLKVNISDTAAMLAPYYKSANTAYVIQASDLATTSTAMVDVTGMSFSVAASGNYIFEIAGRAGSTATNGGRITITVPAGATIEFQSWGTLGGTGTTTTAYGLSGSGTESATFASGAAAGLTSYAFMVKGTVKVSSTAGTVQLRARSINAANTFTIYAGAQMQASKIN